MGFTTLPLQTIEFLQNGKLPIRIDQESACGIPKSDYCQPVELTDRTVFQVNLTEATGIELIINGDMSTACGVDWACGTGWSIAANIAIFAGGGGAGTFQQFPVIRANTLYKVIYTLSNVSSTSLSTIQIGSDFIPLASVAGIETVFIKTGAVANDVVSINGGNGDGFEIDDVSVVEFCTVAFQVINTDNGDIEYEESDGTSVTYHPTLPKAKVDFDWDKVSLGGDSQKKLEICLIGGTILNPESEFQADTTWILSGISSLWTIAGGQASINAVGPGTPPDDRTMTQTNTLLKGNKYTLEVEFASLGGGNLTVDWDGNNIALNITTSGRFPLDDLTLDTVDKTALLEVIGSNLTADFVLESVRITRDVCSECFCLAEKHDCTLLLTWDNTNSANIKANAFQFDYTVLNMEHRLRIAANLNQPEIKDIKRIQRDDSKGTDILFRSRLRIIEKLVTINTHPTPGYIPLAVFAGTGHHNFNIDGTQYSSAQTELNPDWVQESPVATWFIMVFQTSQDFNSLC